MLRREHFHQLAIIFLLIGILSACGRNQGLVVPTEDLSPAVPSPETISPTQTPTDIPPTATPLPLAARVNGEEITLAEFESELSRFRSAQEQAGTSLEVSPQAFVLNDLIDQVLLAQGARQAGFSVSETDVQQKQEQIAATMGGESALQDWMAVQGYTAQSFEKDLVRSLEAAWMRDQIINQVPETAEQVRARQILLYNADQAREVQVQLQNGKDFATLAAEYDPATGGDLGWFPRGYLTDAQLEEAAFSLQPGEFSQIVETPIGFYFLQVIERDPERPLDPDPRRTWQIKALRDWLEKQRNQDSIEILIPTE
jgi:peptidyl-prolyl cis-trans isomerase C